MDIEANILGRILIANEGVNGTLAGSIDEIDKFISYMSSDHRFALIDWKSSCSSKVPFSDLSIRVVDEIVSSGKDAKKVLTTLGFCDDTFGGLRGTGKHLAPKEFHRQLSENNQRCVFDVRNEFEFNIGHFESAIGLGTFTYAESFKALDNIVETQGCTPDTPIYMYCTGGIRCEKASAYLCQRGFENVFQLQGGIHRYLEEYPDGGLFKGKNFVFDSRVAMKTSCPSNMLSTDSSSSTNEPASCPAMKEASSAVSISDSSLTEGTSAVEFNPASTENSGCLPSASEGDVVVGQCIDCRSSHETFSGFIMCTVCRTPVLVCPDCVRSNPHSGEYYCSRHRSLKGIYFTALGPFSAEELSQQEQALLVMEVSMQGDPARKGKRRTLRKQRERVCARKLELLLLQRKEKEGLLGEVVEPIQLDVLAISVTGSVTGMETASATVNSSNAEAADCGDYRERVENRNVSRVNLTQSNRSIGDNDILLSGSDDLFVNPKVLGGWGFWKAHQSF